MAVILSKYEVFEPEIIFLFMPKLKKKPHFHFRSPIFVGGLIYCFHAARGHKLDITWAMTALPETKERLNDFSARRDSRTEQFAATTFEQDA